VSHSTREIGVRMALGAQPGDVFRLVAQQGLAVAGAGILLGLAAGLAVAYLIRGLLFGVAPVDAATFVGVAMLVLVVTAGACAAPAWRAVRVNPLVALRHE